MMPVLVVLDGTVCLTLGMGRRKSDEDVWRGRQKGGGGGGGEELVGRGKAAN